VRNIIARCVADYWNNQAEVLEELSTVTKNETVIIECIEGFSITHSGLLDAVMLWQQQTQHSTELIYFRSVNHEDQLPFVNVHARDANGVWPMSRNYWTDQLKFSTGAFKKFGLFIGRGSVARNVIMYEAFQLWQNDFLFSRFDDSTAGQWNTPFEPLSEWLSSNQHTEIKQWYESCPVASLDQASIRDQYRVDKNTNASLLEHYYKFDVELVAETMTMGTTFFPTEKTTRPIMGMKPFVVYGPKNYLTNLKKLGFKTFDSVWDEDYDNYSGPERWQKIKPVVQYIMDNPTIVNKCHDIVEHNKKILAKKAQVIK
jgi:hypothetical protein